MSTAEYAVCAGKYLTFDLNGERYGVDSMRVVAIIGYQPCTPLPRARNYVKGLTMVRGKVVPVIDARLRLGMAEGEKTPETCIILLMVGNGQTGIVVDAVQDVVDIAEDQFDTVHKRIEHEGILGIAKMEKLIVTLLDVDAMVALS